MKKKKINLVELTCSLDNVAEELSESNKVVAAQCHNERKEGDVGRWRVAT